MSNHLGHRAINELKGTDAGKAFESFIFMELGAAISYKNLNLAITYWRTKSGLEVDFIIGSENPIACEVKIKNRIDKADIKGLLAFAEEAPTKRLILVCLEPAARIMVHNDVKVEILPWQNFLQDISEALEGASIILGSVKFTSLFRNHERCHSKRYVSRALLGIRTKPCTT